MTKKKTLTDKLRENPYMMGTFVLSFVIIFIAGFNFYEAHSTYNDWKEDVCEDMARFQIGTPTWFTPEGYLVHAGYIDMSNSSREDFEAIFLDQGIYLVKRDECGWCQKQIEDLDRLSIWDIYQRKGLVLTCP